MFNYYNMKLADVTKRWQAPGARTRRRFKRRSSYEQLSQKITSDVSSCPFTPGRLPGQMHTQGIRGSYGGWAVQDTSDFVTKSYELLTPS